MEAPLGFGARGRLFALILIGTSIADGRHERLRHLGRLLPLSLRDLATIPDDSQLAKPVGKS